MRSHTQRLMVCAASFAALTHKLDYLDEADILKG